MKRRITIAAATLLLSVVAPVMAQDAPAAPAAPTRQSDAERAEQDAKVDRFCLRETGTLIRRRAPKTGARDGRCTSMQTGRVYTQDDLRSTGQVDIASALRMLDPSVR
ncbi:hypothetical protein [Cognatilysobacter lacus]|uniref:Secreted protein n=1 Tax=Cognatilysobacter lacus TaxID=1643323 RepID=A0A5D8Z5U0_9GAMM|nr:hypothetical protein [Lysobacter lacus]TZF90288.1 hypothetical protein FW784_05995 [Lysobacter lacus]